MKAHRFLFISSLFFFLACNLAKEVEIDLPDYTPQPVVECYLEPGKPFRLTLTRSFAFFDPLGFDTAYLQNAFLQGAVVNIRYLGKQATLSNTIVAESDPLKVYNYVGSDTVPATPGADFYLDILLPDGGTITGMCTMLPNVGWDSIVAERQPDDTLHYRVLAYMTDDLGSTNYYRRVMSINRTDTVPEQDFLVKDEFNETGVFVFGSGYQFKKHYRAYNTLVHLSRDYYDFLESIRLAVAGNQNPFQQPSPIRSNVQGTANPLGIFTCLVADRDTLLVE